MTTLSKPRGDIPIASRSWAYWGTDLTNGYGKASYRQRVTHFTEELTFMSGGDKDWVMGRAILARLGWREGRQRRLELGLICRLTET